MGFVNLPLLFGTLLVGIPIVLHLIMRQQPKPLVFPALRFVQRRRESNRRKLLVRQWMLLVLRCAMLILAAIALARPSVASSQIGNWLVIAALALLAALLIGLIWAAVVRGRGWAIIAPLGTLAVLALLVLSYWLWGTMRHGVPLALGDQEAPVAAVLVFDTSPRMQYRHHNQTRLDEAKETGTWLIRQLPMDSRVAVLSSQPAPAVFAVDLAAARIAITRLQTTGAPRPLSDVVRQALPLLEPSPLRKELYVFSDLSEMAWSRIDADLTEQLQQQKIVLYVIDVGVEEPQNFALAPLKISRESLPTNGELIIETELQHLGPGGTRTVELVLDLPDPNRPFIRDGEVILPDQELRDRQTVTLPANGRQRLEFRVSGLAGGTQQGFVRLVGSDALDVDDARYFSVTVEDPWPVLVVAPSGVNTAALTEALAPLELAAGNKASYRCVAINQTELGGRSLSIFRAVFLLDPEPLAAGVWDSLAAFVQQGGGLAVFLGHHAGAESGWQLPAAEALLVGRPDLQFRTAGDVYLAPERFDHPILEPFREVATSVPWDAFPIHRHWGLTATPAEARVLVRFSNNEPALLERRVGQGTVVVMTTPITEPDRPAGRQSWNELAGPNDWPRFILLNSIADYLVAGGGQPLNYRSGEVAVLNSQQQRFQLFAPSGETQPVRAVEGRLTVRNTEQAGIYRLRGESGTAARGFAVNLPAEASQLQRIDSTELQAQLGKDRFHLARGREQLTRVQGTQRIGSELYPYLALLLAAIAGIEQLLANRFYGKASGGGSDSSAA